MINPMQFSSQAEFIYFVAAMPGEADNLTNIVIGNNAFDIESGNHWITPANTRELPEIERALQLTQGSLQVGSQLDADEINELLSPIGADGGVEGERPPAPVPKTIELRALVVSDPRNREQVLLNDLASHTTPVTSYILGRPGDIYHSPITSNVKVVEQGTFNPPGYYAPMNTQTHKAQGVCSITTGKSPQGSMTESEAFWMLTQQQSTAQILDLSATAESLGAAASFHMPYYPALVGDTLSFGCMSVRNLSVTEEGKEMRFEVINTKTEQKTEVSLTRGQWNTPSIVGPSQLNAIASQVQTGGNSIIISENGHSKVGLVAAAEYILDYVMDHNLDAGNTTDAHKESAVRAAILATRRDIGPDIAATVPELKLLELLFDQALEENVVTTRE